MKKIGFVIPWFAEKIPGGAEMELRGLTEHLHKANIEVEILTTCVKEFTADWNVDYYKTGIEIINGILVRRFKVRKRNTEVFDKINVRLMNGEKISLEDEDIFLREMVNSIDLYEYMSKHQEDYSLFVFIPYMFGTTYYGCQICPEKSVLIPCLHDESYAYMQRFREVYSKIAGMIFHAKPEEDLAKRILNINHVQAATLGEGVNTKLSYHANRFIDKYKITEPFILYAGRKDKGKNVDTLIQYFIEYKTRNFNALKLVLIGGGNIELPGHMKNDICDLGFLPIQDKYDAYAAATVLCQPSKNESFSLVIMESWLCGRPVLVSGECEVTKYFATISNGGLYFSNYFEFQECINYLVNNDKAAKAMGKNGCEFVENNFSWDVIVERYMEFFKGVTGNESNSDY
jgi:glycosyltransferase involved in cell wall biosynthesis